MDRLEFLELIFRGDLLAAYDRDVASAQIAFDSGLRELLGYDQEGSPGMTAAWFDLIHPDDRERVHLAVDAYFGGHAPRFDEDYRVRSRAGEWIWLRDRCRVVARNADDAPTRVRGALRDVSARKATELARRESQERYRRITEAVTDYIFKDMLNPMLITETADGSFEFEGISTGSA